MKTFSELSREEKLDLLTHWVNGNKIEYFGPDKTWLPLENPIWHLDNIYRKAITKPSIDWSIINKKWKWLAIEENGGIYLYEKKPVICKTGWTVAREYMHINDILDINTNNCPWEDSLVERP